MSNYGIWLSVFEAYHVVGPQELNTTRHYVSFPRHSWNAAVLGVSRRHCTPAEDVLGSRNIRNSKINYRQEIRAVNESINYLVQQYEISYLSSSFKGQPQGNPKTIDRSEITGYSAQKPYKRIRFVADVSYVVPWVEVAIQNNTQVLVFVDSTKWEARESVVKGGNGDGSKH
ncbi:hypothetical protein J6590_075399 [Homalodisca vitripennis]|nr:hypothetical protein J6590_075399 [Homalodisca vitripennis]